MFIEIMCEFPTCRKKMVQIGLWDWVSLIHGLYRVAQKECNDFDP